MRDVVQGTARKFKIYMADSASPTTAKTGLTTFTVYLAKEGLAESTVTVTIADRGHGWYEVTPIAAHRDTLGENAWTFTAAGAVDYPFKESVVKFDAQDGVRGGLSGVPNATAGTVGGGPVLDVNGRVPANVESMDDDVLSAAAIAADAGAEIAALVETYIVNEGDATAVMQAIADQIAADWVAGDASPMAIATAVWAAANRTLTALPAAPQDWINAASVAASALDGKGDWSTHDAAAVKTAIEQVGSMLQKLFAMTEADGAVQRFTANALELGGSNVTVTDITQPALAKFLTEDTGETTAAAGSVGRISQGSAADNSAQLQRIEDQTALITAGKITIVSTVTLGGDITLKKGSDYRSRSDTAVPLKVSDPGGTLRTVLQDDTKVAKIIFGAGNQSSANVVTGAIDADSITYANDQTTIPIEITAEQLANAKAAEYQYHIKAIAPVVTGETAGDEVVKLEGCCIVQEERAMV